MILPRRKDVPLREVSFDDLQVWVSGLSVDGSARFEGRGLSASRVRQAHQLIGAVLKFGGDSLIWPQRDGLERLHLCGGGVSVGSG
ncbi:hypothetical protein AWC08_02335 [Mycobacterium gordonae]|uniref:Uncharacterized protein n=1 Tax=Mycobacterium gordonae TaxID=1778 RepID=A0A1X1VW36_MYCGO|nr:hypothetical protein AWC08_02335 [Mycobacterium gordonae]